MNDHDLLERIAADAPVPGPGYSAHVLSAARRVRTRRRVAAWGAALSTVALSMVGTAAVVQAVGGGPPPSVPPATAGPAQTVHSPAAEAGAYAAAIRALAEEVRQGGPPWPIVYVFGFTCENVIRPADPTCAPQILPGSLRADIASGLASYAHVEFVTDRQQVTDAHLDIINGGVLVTLGRIQIHGGTAEVPVSVRRGGLNGRGLTYVLRHQNGTWKVNGTIGQGWIS